MSHALWPRDLIVVSRWHQEKAEINSCSHKQVREVQRWFSFYLEAVFEPLWDEEEDYWIYAGVDGRHVDAEVVEHQQEAATTEEERAASVEEDWEVILFHIFASVLVRLLQQLAAVSVVGSVDGSLQQATQVKREPAQSEDQNQAEHGFGHLTALWRDKPASESDSLCRHQKLGSSSSCLCVYLFDVFAQGDPQTSLPVSQHLASHQAVEDRREDHRHAEVEAKQPPVLRIPVELEHGEAQCH